MGYIGKKELTAPFDGFCGERNEDVYLGEIFEAQEKAVYYVLSQSDNPHDDDGRSSWMWIRLANGDLILGVYPQGDTYTSIEGWVEEDYKAEPPEMPQARAF